MDATGIYQAVTAEIKSRSKKELQGCGG